MIITINDDFDLYKIAYSGQCFRVTEIDDNTFCFVTKNSRVTIKALGEDKYDISCSKSEWDMIWHDYFDLDTCYKDIRSSIPATDTYLTMAAELGKGIRILKQDKFEMLISFIISQRKSIPAIKTSVNKLCSLYGVNDFFPTPDALCNATYDELKSCGLGYRVHYIIDAVNRVAHKDVVLDDYDTLDDDSLMEALKSFNGVGDKVANCVALFAYHRVGRAPIDTWIKKVIDSQYNGNNPFSNYDGYAGIMQQYMFYAAQHMREL